MDVIIREARTDDAAAILDVLNPIIESDAVAFDAPLTEADERGYIASFPSRGVFHVALRCGDGRLVGFQSMEPFATYTSLFDHVGVLGTYVVAACRRQQVARRLFAATFATARAVTQTAYVVTNKTDGRRMWMTVVGIGMLVFGLLAMLANVILLGLTGIVVFGAGAVLLAFCLGPKTVGVLRLLLALAVLLLAAAPWLPWLNERIFPWLSKTAVPSIDNNRWVWPVLLFLVLLPPLTSLSHLVKRRPQK